MAAVVPGRALGLTYHERAPISTQSAFAALQSPHGTPSPCFAATPTLHFVPPLHLPPAAVAATALPWGLQPSAAVPAPAQLAVGKRASLPASLGDAAAVFGALPRRAPTAPLATSSAELAEEGDMPVKAQSAMELGTGVMSEQGHAQPPTPAGAAVAVRSTARRTSAPALFAAPWPLPASPAAAAPLTSPVAAAHGRCFAAAAPVAVAGGCAVRAGGPVGAVVAQPLTFVAAPARAVPARAAPATPTVAQSPSGLVLVSPVGASPMLAPGSPSWSVVAPKVRRKPRVSGPGAAAAAPAARPPAPAQQWTVTEADEDCGVDWAGAGDCADLYYDQKELFTKGWTREAKQSHSAKSVKKVDYQADKRRQQSARDKAKNMGLTLDDLEE